MSGAEGPDGSEIVMPGFRGRVVGRFSGMLVVEGEIHGHLPAHAATSDELAVVMEGCVEVELPTGLVRLEAGGHLVVPAGMSHAVRAIGMAKVLLIGAPD